MLFLNAGIGQGGPVVDIPASRIQRMLRINVEQPTYVCKALIGQMYAREKRSAIVVTSSGLGLLPVAGLTVYAATKAYTSSFAQALSYENENKVDVVDYILGMTDTKFFDKSKASENEKRGPKATPPDVAVKGLMRAIGHDRQTSGCRAHEQSSWTIKSAPVGAVNRMMYKAVNK